MYFSANSASVVAPTPPNVSFGPHLRIPILTGEQACPDSPPGNLKDAIDGKVSHFVIFADHKIETNGITRKLREKLFFIEKPLNKERGCQQEVGKLATFLFLSVSKNVMYSHVRLP